MYRPSPCLGSGHRCHPAVKFRLTWWHPRGVEAGGVEVVIHEPLPDAANVARTYASRSFERRPTLALASRSGFQHPNLARTCPQIDCKPSARRAIPADERMATVDEAVQSHREAARVDKAASHLHSAHVGGARPQRFQQSVNPPLGDREGVDVQRDEVLPTGQKDPDVERHSVADVTRQRNRSHVPALSEQSSEPS